MNHIGASHGQREHHDEGAHSSPAPATGTIFEGRRRRRRRRRRRCASQAAPAAGAGGGTTGADDGTEGASTTEARASAASGDTGIARPVSAQILILIVADYRLRRGSIERCGFDIRLARAQQCIQPRAKQPHLL
jgi:hypothetical protein